ncbi:MAG: hypothetical protein ACKOCJ_01675 [Burkholderiaceae bacterium]
MAYSSESRAFSERLRQALEAAGIRPSPTRVANEFNGRYWGKSITPHTARNWLIGKSIPTQDKLRVLSDWLHVSPDVLRFGSLPQAPHAAEPLGEGSEADLVDRELIQRYLSLTPRDRKTVRDVVTALTLAASVRASGPSSQLGTLAPVGLAGDAGAAGGTGGVPVEMKL